MTIFRTAYDTLACDGFVMTKTEHALDAALHTGHLDLAPNTHVLQLTGGASIADAVPAFVHPLEFKDPKGETGKIVIDARSFGKYDIHKGGFVVRNKTEYEFLLLRGRLNHCWLMEAPQLLMTVSPLGMKFFSAWIAENVAKKFLLDPREKVQLQIYAAFYYYSLFLPDVPFDQVMQHRIIATIVKSTGINASLVVDLVDHFEVPVKSIDEFCKLAQEVCSSIRLAQLNRGILYAILGNTWYASNGKEIVTVALEHPPTWLAMVSMAAQDRSFKNSAVNKLIESLDRRDKGATFVRAVKMMLDAAQA